MFIKIERSVRPQTVYEHSPAGKRYVSRPRKNNETNTYKEGKNLDDLRLISDDDDEICFINSTEVCVSVVKFKLVLNIYSAH